MYELEIETKNTLKKITNPRKARIRYWVLVDVLQVMDDDGKWHNVCTKPIITHQYSVIREINDAIKNRKKSVYLDI